MGDHTTTGDGRLDEGVELLVTTDGELKVAGVMRFTCYVRRGKGWGVSKPEELSSTRLDREKFKRAAVDAFETRNVQTETSAEPRARGARTSVGAGDGRGDAP